MQEQNPPPLQVDFYLDKADIKAANRAILARGQRLKASSHFLVYRPVAPWLLLGLSLLLFVAIFAAAPGFVALYPSFWFLAFGLAYSFLIYHSFKLFRFNALSRPENGGFFYGPRKAEAGSDGLAVVGERSSAFYAWSAFIDLLEDETHLFLFLDNNSVLALPKLAFPTQDEAEDFADFCRDQIRALS